LKTLLRNVSIGTGRSGGSWLLLLMALLVLAPSACLLWFMNRAMQNERLALRQKLVDAYRGHLSLAQERLETFLRQTARELDASAERQSPSALFAAQVRAGKADAIVCFDPSGNVLYPDARATPPRAAPDSAWADAQALEGTNSVAAADAFARIAQRTPDADLAARALQAQARCLIQSGRQQAAISVLERLSADQRYARTTDFQGRLLVPNAELMALELLRDSTNDEARVFLQRLETRLLDYANYPMASGQRRFLLREMLQLHPDRAIHAMMEAEDLAAQFVEAGAAAHAGQPGLRASPLPGVWQLTSAGGTVIALHRTGNLLARLRAAAASETLPSDVRLDLLAPGQEADSPLLTMPSGQSSPGWHLGLALKDQQLIEAAAAQRAAAYFWTGALVVATVLMVAMLALRLVRRQLALTELRNDLVANVTHELKTPLSSMRLLVETLLNSETLHQQTAREYLQLIARENVRLSRLIDNFLTFSRIERNKYAFDFNETSPAAIVDAAAAAVRERFNAPDCRFAARVAPGLPPVLADADAMVTALLNLLENAWKYSGESKEITLTAGTENGTVCFAVTDNGVGLTPRETKRIFKRFYQVDQRLSRSAGGCGLGLSIVKFVVMAHHGNVRVESEPGRGSTFTITLPAASTTQSAEVKA
jgi:signal transduction histidine kinase